MTLATLKQFILAEKTDNGVRLGDHDLERMAATVRLADELLERCESAFWHPRDAICQDGGKCGRCKILAEIRAIRGGTL